MIEEQESITAQLCLFARAFHSNYGKEKIFDDYLSFDLMGREQYEEIGQLIENDFDPEKFDRNSWFCHKIIKDILYKYILPIPLSRIKFAEIELENFAKLKGAMGEKIQYVICGAGMDSFAFRNQIHNIKIFEVDHPDTQRYKLERIKKLEWIIPENLTFVPVDFSKDSLKEKLLEKGFDSNLPTFTAILGVTYYLTLPVFEQTLKIISELSPEGSKLIFDFPDERTFSEELKKNAPRVQELADVTEKLGEPMLHGFSTEEVKQALERNAFELASHYRPETIQDLYFEGRSDGLKAYENVHFIVAEKTS
jgi:methyltransferase (TIGR00027 family)